MPPVTPQSSRSGLITAVVIFTILFVTATIFAIYYGVEASKAQLEATTLRSQYNAVVSEGATEGGLTSLEVRELLDLRKTQGGNATAMRMALQQRNQLARAITGVNQSTLAQAQKATADALAQAAQNLPPDSTKLPSPTDNLAGAMDVLTKTVADSQAKIEELNKQLKDAQNSQALAIKEKDQVLADKDKQIADIRAQADAAIASAAEYRSSQESQLASIQTGFSADISTATDSQQKLQAQLAAKDATLQKLQEDIDTLRDRLLGQRGETNDPIIRRADGEIVRLPGNGVVYINLGLGDQITPGMTFQVYDKIDGIPELGDGVSEENMPIGKASIEVTRVGATSSEARIIKQQPGMSLMQGDLLVNLVYDPNVKYNFFVYGNFDMDRNGVATPGDAEIVKRLVTQWGGKLTDQVNVDTDFVILGAEPQIPEFTTEEMDPINTRLLAEAQTALDAYMELRKNARELNIPILNQNRFLYFVGYYDLAKR